MGLDLAASCGPASVSLVKLKLKSKCKIINVNLLRKVSKIRRSQVLKAIDSVNSFTFERCEVTHPLFGVDSNVKFKSLMIQESAHTLCPAFPGIPLLIHFAQ